MLATLVIVFREVIEAGLIVGIVLAATQGVSRRGLWVGYGIVGGVLGACLVAAFAGELASLFEGSGQEIFNATILLLAVCMLTWHNVWMAGHGREMAREMKTVGAEVSAGQRSLAALAIVVGVAVLREGSEVVLFLYGIASQGGTIPGLVQMLAERGGLSVSPPVPCKKGSVWVLSFAPGEPEKLLAAGYLPSALPAPSPQPLD